MAEKEKIEEEILVVEQLPTQQVVTGEVDGKRIRFITKDEALKEILEIVRDLKVKIG